MMVPFFGNRAVAKLLVDLMQRSGGIKAFDGGGQDKRAWPAASQAIGTACLLSVPVVGRRAAAKPILNEFNRKHGTTAKVPQLA